MQSRQAQLVRASELYYERGLSQQKIADILGVSRPTVSRLLEEARKSGVVEIVVHAPLKQNYELSERLRRELGLKDAVVIQGEASPDRSPALRRCAQAAGQLFLSLLESGMTVGLSWGRVLRQFCDTLPQQKHTFNVNVVQTIGCLGTGNPHLDGLELTLALAKKLNGTFYNVYAPVYVDSALVQSYLLREPSVELAIRQAGQAISPPKSGAPSSKPERRPSYRGACWTGTVGSWPFPAAMWWARRWRSCIRSRGASASTPVRTAPWRRWPVCAAAASTCWWWTSCWRRRC